MDNQNKVLELIFSRGVAKATKSMGVPVPKQTLERIEKLESEEKEEGKNIK
ncbi:MAG: hypothetical protein ACD_19C00185G0007 [uncultured bacterium]|nr:MAG: hypothetical protein ACD_19C00185G0007 [uncultured bacterium]